MSISMEMLGQRYTAAGKKVDPLSTQDLGRFAEVGVGLVKQAIQDYHAVDTGTMLNSTTKQQLNRTTYLIGPTVDYAKYVGLGTSRMAARPFHVKAAKQLNREMRSYGFTPRKLGI